MIRVAERVTILPDGSRIPSCKMRCEPTGRDCAAASSGDAGRLARLKGVLRYSAEEIQMADRGQGVMLVRQATKIQTSALLELHMWYGSLGWVLEEVPCRLRRSGAVGELMLCEPVLALRVVPHCAT